MAPNTKEKSTQLEYEEVFTKHLAAQAEPRKYTLVYSSILIFAYWHLAALYGLYLSTSAKWATLLFSFLMYLLGGFGVTAGTHRLWAHRSYKAKLPLQIILMLFQTLSCQSTVLVWVKDHRTHHKYCDTDADPHNSTRGFFFSHIGWLMVKRHPETIQKGRTIDMSDLLDNPVLQFQKKQVVGAIEAKSLVTIVTMLIYNFFFFFISYLYFIIYQTYLRYYLILASLLVLILPTLIPVYFWQENISNAHFVHMLTLVIGCHITFSINSVAHFFGNKPYDRNISPTQNLSLSLFAFGEGYHNYHHTFPFDYRVAELGNNYLNFSTKLIDFFAWIGWAYDLKYASPDMITNRTKRTGDGTNLWGRVEDEGSEQAHWHQHGEDREIEDTTVSRG